MNANDYGWFTPADFQLVLNALHKNHNPSSPIVLVGGQALVAWVKHYNITIPDTETPALTQDVDFFGNALEARLLAEALGAQITIASMDDHTANIAVINFRSPTTGKILVVDFLNQLIGLMDSEVRELAVPLKFESLSEVYVLHPILCLKSRIENLYKLASKRNGNGKTQAEKAIEVVREFLKEYLQEENAMRKIFNAINRLKKIALSDAGIYVYHAFGLDILSSIESVPINNKNFETNGWPRLIKEVAAKREKRIPKITD